MNRKLNSENQLTKIMSKSFSTKFGNIPVVKKNKIEEESDSSVDSDESGTIYLSIKSILRVY